MTSMLNPRRSAVDILLKIEKQDSYSNLVLSSYFKENELKGEDKAFISAIVYGVLDRKITLDYVLSKHMKTPVKKTAPFTLCVLRTALYQIMFMDKVPESAAVNEAVKIIKKSRENRNAGFVNAVLRSVLREKTELPCGNSVKDMSIRYSAPESIVESFVNDYGCEETEAMLKEFLKPAPVILRVNTLKTSADDLAENLRNTGVETERVSENALKLIKGMDLSDNRLFKNGFFHIEDLACQMAIEALKLKKGERVLDLCASPGGKSFTMAEIMENEGEIVACDIYEQRVKLIRDGAERLGIDIIKPAVNDATVYNESLGKFDAVLCDVPCSGYGVIKRKPEIKYKQVEDYTSLENTQFNILCTALKYLKPDGRLLYSTCTLRHAENEGLVFRVKREYNKLCVLEEKTFMPHIDNTDGFYYALLCLENREGNLSE